MNRVFLDTDVIIDFYVARQPHHDVALRLFTHLKTSKVPTFTSAVVISNAYYVLAKTEGRKFALERMRKLRRLLSVAPLSEGAVDAALAAPGKDFEDSLQIQCAMENGIGTLITRNTRDFPKDRIKVTEPLQYLSAATLLNRS